MKSLTMRNKPRGRDSSFWRVGDKVAGSKTRKFNNKLTVEMSNELDEDERDRDFFFGDDPEDDENFDSRSAKSKGMSVTHSTVSRTKRSKFNHK